MFLGMHTRSGSRTRGHGSAPSGSGRPVPRVATVHSFAARPPRHGRYPVRRNAHTSTMRTRTFRGALPMPHDTDTPKKWNTHVEHIGRCFPRLRSRLQEERPRPLAQRPRLPPRRGSLHPAEGSCERGISRYFISPTCSAGYMSLSMHSLTPAALIFAKRSAGGVRKPMGWT